MRKGVSRKISVLQAFESHLLESGITGSIISKYAKMVNICETCE